MQISKDEIRQLPVKDVFHNGLSALQLEECLRHVRSTKPYRKVYDVSETDVFTIGYVPYVIVCYGGKQSDVVISNRVDSKLMITTTLSRDEFVRLAEDGLMYAKY